MILKFLLLQRHKMDPIHEAFEKGDLAQLIEILEQDPTLINKKAGCYGKNCCDSFGFAEYINS